MSESPQVLTSASTGQTVTPEWAALGVTQGFKPPSPYEVGMILLSWSGAGKTTFVSSIPECLLVEFTNAASAVPGPRSHRVRIRTHEQWVALRDKLVAAKKTGNSPYRMVAFDTIDEWFGIMCQPVIQAWNAVGKHAQTQTIGNAGAEGSGYNEVADSIERDLRLLLDNQIGWVATGHLREKTVPVGDKEMIEVRPVLTDSSFRRVVRLAFLRAHITSRLQTEGTQTLPTGQTVRIKLAQPRMVRQLTLRTSNLNDELKKRLDHLPEQLDLPRHDAWKALQTAWQEAVTKGESDDAALRNAK